MLCEGFARSLCGKGSDEMMGWQVHSLSGHFSEVISVVFSPDGKLVVSASEDTTIKIWDTETGAEVRCFVG